MTERGAITNTIGEIMPETTEVIEEEMTDEEIEVTDDDLEEPVEVPPSVAYGNFQVIGQKYDGLTVSFTDHEGENAKGEPCPEIKLKLLRPAVVYREGDAVEVPAGDEITITVGQMLLAKALIKIWPQEGQRISIEYTGLKGRAKEFAVRPGKRPFPF
jgi:hypothetical protein